MKSQIAQKYSSSSDLLKRFSYVEERTRALIAEVGDEPFPVVAIFNYKLLAKESDASNSNGERPPPQSCDNSTTSSATCETLTKSSNSSRLTHDLQTELKHVKLEKYLSALELNGYIDWNAFREMSDNEKIRMFESCSFSIRDRITFLMRLESSKF